MVGNELSKQKCFEISWIVNDFERKIQILLAEDILRVFGESSGEVVVFEMLLKDLVDIKRMLG